MRPELGSTVVSLLAAVAQGAAPAGKATVNRLALVAIAVAVRTPNGGVGTLAAAALRWGEAGSAEGLAACFEVLTLLPAQVDAADVPRAAKDELQRGDLAAALPAVLRLASLVLAQGHPGGGGGGQDSAGGGGEPDSNSSRAAAAGKQRSSALACVGAWFAGVPPGVGLGALASGAAAGAQGQVDNTNHAPAAITLSTFLLYYRT
jgi:hypothetical protein